MTPAKRRPAAPASQGPTRTAPDVPAAPPDVPVPDELVTTVPPVETKDDTELLGPDGEPIVEEPPTGDASGDSAPPPETGLYPDLSFSRTHVNVKVYGSGGAAVGAEARKFAARAEAIATVEAA